MEILTLTAAPDASVLTLSKLLLRGSVSWTASKSISLSHSSTGAPLTFRHSSLASYLVLDVSDRRRLARSSSIRVSRSGPFGSLRSTWVRNQKVGDGQSIEIVGNRLWL